jgi:DNA-binding transcriptional MerR regulator
MEYTWSDLAEILGVSESTVRRSVKKLGLEGTLTDSEDGGTKRIFSEVDVERLKAVTDRPQLPAKREGEAETGLSTGLSTALATLEEIGTALALLPDLREQLDDVINRLDGIQAEGQRREEETRCRETEARQREEELRAELQAAREETERQLTAFREAVQEREETLLEQLSAIQAELARPWWERLWSRRRK